MSSAYKQFTEKVLNSMFFRLVTPTNNLGEVSSKVIPDLSLGNVRSVYIPTTDSAVNTQNWTYKVMEVSLSDKQRIPILKEQINEKLKTVLYIHGFMDSTNSISVRTIVNGYLERGDHNILLLDWSIGSRHYLYTVVSVQKIGDRIKERLEDLEDYGVITTNNIHVVGHSIGAHIAAAVCKKLRNVRRLTGLDPAGPLFEWSKNECLRICNDDAEFVDIIHTDGTRFGMTTPLGHVDFYPNGGTMLQPGCKICYNPKLFHSKRFCSHWRSWMFFSERLVRERAFLAGAADSWEDFKKGNISTVIPMGFLTPIRSSGRYYLQTAGSPPFGEGENGLKYKSKLSTD